MLIFLPFTDDWYAASMICAVLTASSPVASGTSLFKHQLMKFLKKDSPDEPPYACDGSN